MIVRAYGSQGPPVIVLHGGPAAAGEVAPLARELADRFQVLEPWQRGSGKRPLTVQRHVEDLRDLVAACGQAWRRPAIVGHSWGAMLALVYAASHPDLAGPVVLVGCGTFDETSRDRLHATLAERMDEDLRGRLARLPAECPDPAEQLRRRHELTRPLYDFDAEPAEPLESGPLDVRAHTETWQDMLRLQEEGVYPPG
jgi:pimeloyl-ACP methyl ester carboxylesterase